MFPSKGQLSSQLGRLGRNFRDLRTLFDPLFRTSSRRHLFKQTSECRGGMLGRQTGGKVKTSDSWDLDLGSTDSPASCPDHCNPSGTTRLLPSNVCPLRLHRPVLAVPGCRCMPPNRWPRIHYNAFSPADSKPRCARYRRRPAVSRSKPAEVSIFLVRCAGGLLAGVNGCRLESESTQLLSLDWRAESRRLRRGSAYRLKRSDFVGMGGRSLGNARGCAKHQSAPKG
jgi:hypothetical protein